MMLFGLVGFALTFLAVSLAIPAFIFTAECLLAMLPPRRVSRPRSDARYVVIIPAHDEERGLGETLERLEASVDDARGSVLVIADNCTDRTAGVARAHGVRVLERFDPDRRGKGYALAYAVATLAETPPDVLVFVDADCLVEPGSIDVLVDACMASGRPAQADYVLEPADDSPRAMIGALAFLVRNRVRPRGLARVGGPCGLFGTGMAMPYGLFTSLPNAEGHLVEDMWLGVACALMGRAPEFCPEARVTSRGASGDDAARAQSTRWEHGHLGVMRTHVPRLLAGDTPSAVALGLDLAVPPLALLVGLELALFVPTLVFALLGFSALPLAIVVRSLFLVGASVLLAWFVFGRSTIPARALLGIPRYVLFKIPVYLRFLREKQTRWVRTDRS